MGKTSGVNLNSYIYIRSRAAPKLIWCQITKELILEEDLCNRYTYVEHDDVLSAFLRNMR